MLNGPAVMAVQVPPDTVEYEPTSPLVSNYDPVSNQFPLTTI
jgi:hypothetical protein